MRNPTAIRANLDLLRLMSATAPEATSTPATLTSRSPTHQEVILHFAGQIVPQSVIDAKLSRGEAFVRRSMREWPYGSSLRVERLNLSDRIVLSWFMEPDVVSSDGETI